MNKSTWDVVRPALDIWIVAAFTFSIINGLVFLATFDWDNLIIALLFMYVGLRELDDKIEQPS